MRDDEPVAKAHIFENMGVNMYMWLRHRRVDSSQFGAKIVALLI